MTGSAGDSPADGERMAKGCWMRQLKRRFDWAFTVVAPRLAVAGIGKDAFDPELEVPIFA